MVVIACSAMSAWGQAHTVQGFEAGDPAFTSTGDVGKVGTFQGQAPPQGSMQLLLTTIGSMSNEDGLTPQSGSPAVSNLTLQNFAGIGLAGVEGSAVLIPFSVSSGETGVSFQYDFLTNELFQSMPRDDFAFAAVLDNASSVVASLNPFVREATAAFDLFGGQAPFQFHTGVNSLSFSLAPGDYTLAIGVEDKSTADHASGLLIDNIQVIPEPSVLALAAAGGALMVAFRRKMKRGC